MKYVYMVIASLVLISIVEGWFYLFCAFCAWDLNWFPEADGFTRFVYGVVSTFLFIGSVGTAIEAVDSEY